VKERAREREKREKRGCACLCTGVKQTERVHVGVCLSVCVKFDHFRPTQSRDYFFTVETRGWYMREEYKHFQVHLTAATCSWDSAGKTLSSSVPALQHLPAQLKG
jgi:hypothetical protein